jgi:hypothetical protein
MESLHEEDGKVRRQAKEFVATMKEMHGLVDDNLVSAVEAVLI